MFRPKSEKKAKPIIKPGKVVILLAGRHAGQKAVVVKFSEEGDRARKFGHVLVAGLERAPQKVTKSMSKAKIEQRSKVKTFVKYVNVSHILLTRYTVSEEKLKKIVTNDALSNVESRKEARANLKKVYEGHYLNRPRDTPGFNFFFKKLRF